MSHRPGRTRSTSTPISHPASSVCSLANRSMCVRCSDAAGEHLFETPLSADQVLSCRGRDAGHGSGG